MEENRAPKFRMWCDQKLHAMHMTQDEWGQIVKHAEMYHELNLQRTPIGSFAENPALRGALLGSPSTGVFELDLLRDRGDKHSSSERLATYRYEVHETFPRIFDFEQAVVDASTTADLDLESFVNEQVWFLPIEKSEIDERYIAFPSSALGIFRPGSDTE